MVLQGGKGAAVQIAGGPAGDVRPLAARGGGGQHRNRFHHNEVGLPLLTMLLIFDF